MEKADHEPRESQADAPLMRPSHVAAENKVRPSQQPTHVWDCESSLYDSFELKSFERHLSSAISSRTFSMPHLSDRRTVRPPTTSSKKSSSKISRSLHKLLKSVFRPKHSARPPSNAGGEWPEIPECGGDSPEIGPFVRRTASDRFKPMNSVGISCA